MTKQTITSALVDKVLALHYDALPAEAVDMAKAVTLDGLGVMIAGAGEPLGVGRILRPGKDVTVVGLSWMNVEARLAADILQKRGVSLELVDPRTLSPLDEGLIVDSVRRTGYGYDERVEVMGSTGLAQAQALDHLAGLVGLAGERQADGQLALVADLQRLKRSGGWLVLRVDSRHRIAHSGEGKDALAVTVGGSGGGVVYVISDRLGGRDLSGVMMHEFGHVLGAGHGQHGLMAPVYSLDGARCIDYAAAGLVAQAQRLPLAGMNWCEGLGRERMPAANAGANHGYTSSSVRGQARD